ncbi:MAG: hypothetical protein ACOC4B_00985 [Bacteroidota bacterium]
MEKINKTEALEKRLSQENKVTYLDKPEHKKAIEIMNKSMEKMRREFQKKDQKSEQSAKDVILTD